MSKVKRLMDNYESHIAVPWREVAPAQRVIFCVYPESDERKLRAKLEEFELITRKYKHGWVSFDLTNTFAEWFASLKYAKSYYEKPKLLSSIIQRYGDYIEAKFMEHIANHKANEEDVIALCGVGSVFGFVKVREIVDRLSPKVPGRLLVFFPGSYENNNYRLLDGYDGWNYHATAITSEKDI